MLDMNASLHVVVDDKNISSKMANFDRDEVEVDFLEGNYLYFGFRKPIQVIYFNHHSEYEPELELTLEYHNGGEWKEVTNLVDETLGLKRSGFIQWDREQKNQKKNQVEGVSNYWYRISLDGDREELKLAGINLVFASDYDLAVEKNEILAPEFMGSKQSYILTHVAARKEILNRLRGPNYVIYRNNGKKDDVNAFDLFDIHELKLAAVFLAISKIYLGISDSPDDVWRDNSNHYRSLYESNIEKARKHLSIDTNDDGKEQSNESKRSFNHIRMTR